MTLTSWAIDTIENDAQVMRQAFDSLIGTPGIVATGHLELTQKASPNMSVECAAGQVWVAGTITSQQSIYFINNSAALNIAVPAADATNPRIERAVARIADAAYSGAESLPKLELVKGTATPGATLGNLSGVAAAPASSFTLGYVLVPALASSIVTADIANVATVLLPTALSVPASAKYGASASYAGTEIVPSATRPAFVTVTAELEKAAVGAGLLTLTATVGGVARLPIQGTFPAGSAGPIIGDSFLVPPGIKWKAIAIDSGGTSAVVMHQQSMIC